MPIPSLTPDRHLDLIERILHHIVRIQLIHLPNNHIHIRLMRFRKQEKLRAGQGLEACQAEGLRFEDLDAGFGGWREGEGGWG